MMPFVVWMIGWPVACSICNALFYWRGERVSSITKSVSALIDLAVWIVIAIALWRRAS